PGGEIPPKHMGGISMYYRTAALLLSGLLCPMAIAAPTIDFNNAKRRCAPALEDEPKVYSQDFKWGYEFQEMADRYKEIYQSGKRLHMRAYFDPAQDQFVFPGETTRGEAYTVKIPTQFIANIGIHLEEGLKRDYADYVFFPDIGHSHFFIPVDFYNEVIRPLPTDQKAKRYELLMGHAGVKVLYHTAEQLGMKDKESKELFEDDYLRWRYYTRNLVGYNTGTRKVEIHKKLNEGFNTVHDHDGGDYRYWGAGFNVSASKDGCFAFKTKEGETHYFDLSLEDLPYDQSRRSENDFLYGDQSISGL
ncbi:MAG: hypothetical protein AAF202_02075, partial [Pseudomonadota bacterium]